MNILVITDHVPMPDRASGELRFFSFLKILAESHNILLCPFNFEIQQKNIGVEKTVTYVHKAIKIGVVVNNDSILKVLKTHDFDWVMFEFYHCVERFIGLVRMHQPKARVLIDSVDVHYKRFHAKALLTNEKRDFEEAKNVRCKEIAAYMKGDLTIVVTKEDADILKEDAPAVKTGVIPNIHDIPEYRLLSPPYKNLLFVGSFKHDPNIDAVIYFCREIVPILNDFGFEFRLEIVGPYAPPEVNALSSQNIVVSGYVENIEECYRRNHISIAPLRYGGGIKGKVGEAMSYGLPVVTTQYGIEGFGLSVGEDILVAENPLDFAKAIIQLSQDRDLYQKISHNGYRFIKNRYSESAAKLMAIDLDKQVNAIKPPNATFFSMVWQYICYPYYCYLYLKPVLQNGYNTYIGWRFKHEWTD